MATGQGPRGREKRPGWRLMPANGWGIAVKIEDGSAGSRGGHRGTPVKNNPGERVEEMGAVLGLTL